MQKCKLWSLCWDPKAFVGEGVPCPMSWALARVKGARLSSTHIPAVWVGKHSLGQGSRVRGYWGTGVTLDVLKQNSFLEVDSVWSSN